MVHILITISGVPDERLLTANKRRKRSSRHKEDAKLHSGSVSLKFKWLSHTETLPTITRSVSLTVTGVVRFKSKGVIVGVCWLLTGKSQQSVNEGFI